MCPAFFYFNTMRFKFCTLFPHRFSAKHTARTAKEGNASICVKLGVFAFFAYIIASFTSCSGINDSWEVKGGGFLKYSINDGEEVMQELDRDDVEIPYIRNQHHYIKITIPMNRSDRKDQLSVAVYSPKLGKNNIVPSLTWIQVEGTPKALIKGEDNYVTFDQKDDTKWSATFNLHFEDCRQGACIDSLPPILFKGRMHYWIAEDDR